MYGTVLAPADARVLTQRRSRKVHHNLCLAPRRADEDVLDALLVQRIPRCETASNEFSSEPAFAIAPTHAECSDVNRVLFPLYSVDEGLLKRQQPTLRLSGQSSATLSIVPHVGRGHHRHSYDLSTFLRPDCPESVKVILRE